MTIAVCGVAALNLVGKADDALTAWEWVQEAGFGTLRWVLTLAVFVVAIGANWDWLGLHLPFARRHRFMGYLRFLADEVWDGSNKLTLDQQSQMDEALGVCYKAGLIGQLGSPVMLHQGEMWIAYDLLKRRHTVRHVERVMRARRERGLDCGETG